MTPEIQILVVAALVVLIAAVLVIGLFAKARARGGDALRKRLRAHELILGRSSEGFCVTGPDGRIREVNSAYCRCVGYGREELLAMSLVDLEALETPDQVHAHLEKVREQGVDQFETRYRCKDGTLVDLEVTVTRTELNGEPHCIACIRDISERVRAVAELRESRRILRQALDCIPVRVFWKDRDSRYLGCNRLFAQDAGLESPEEIVGKHDDELSWPTDAAAYVADDRDVIESGVPKLAYEELQTRPDGTVLWLETSKVPLTDSAGNTVGVLGTYADITGRKHAEQVLHRERDFTAAVLDTIGSLVVVMDRQGEIVSFNHECESLTGYTFAEVVGRPVWEFLLVPEEVDAVKRVFADLKVAKLPSQYENYWVTRSGERRLIAWKNTVLEGDDGRVEYIIATGIDITERKAVEHALNALATAGTRFNIQEFYRVCVSSLAAAFEVPYVFIGLVSGPDRNRVTTQAVWMKTDFGDNFEYELKGTPCQDILDRSMEVIPVGAKEQYPDDRILVDMGIDAYMGVPLLSSDGHVIGLVSVMDTHPLEATHLKRQILTMFARRIAAEVERERVHQELRGMYRQLESRVQQRTAELTSLNRDLVAANKELEAFSYSVSHDLLAPLRGIDGFSQVLLEDYGARLDDAGRETLRRVRSGAQRMAGLIDKLLQLSRVARAEVRRETVDLGAMARDIIEDLRADSGGGRKVEFVCPERLEVRADAHLLRVAMENLLQNAWKYTANEPEGCIELGVREEPGGQSLFVRDNGVGFDMKYADTLFSSFQRLHRSSDFPGAGVGLATVQRVMERHGGRVWAEAEPGRGATIHFSLDGPPETPTAV